MAITHGSRAVFQIGTAGTPATPVDISTSLSSVSFPIEVETAETTTLQATAKSYIPGLEDATISLEGRFSTTIDAHLAALRRIASVAFVYGPIGSTAALPRYSGNCTMTSYSFEAGLDDAVTFSAEFQVTGAVTRGVF